MVKCTAQARLSAAVVGFMLVLSVCVAARAQSGDGPLPSGLDRASLPDAPAPQSGSSTPVTIRGTPLNVLKDQKAIWTSPAHIHERDLKWLLPLAAATGVAIATDHHTMSAVVSHDPRFNHDNVDVSNTLTGAFIVVPAGIFLDGQLEGDSRARETGILGGESVVDALVLQEGMKFIFWRERPHQDNARGLFFQSSAGTDSSFPSSHSIVSWSSAAVLAEEYPSPWVRVGVYSMATGVSLTRVLGQEHFPTDVLVGSAFGWLVGHYVYRTRHWRFVHAH